MFRVSLERSLAGTFSSWSKFLEPAQTRTSESERGLVFDLINNIYGHTRNNAIRTPTRVERNPLSGCNLPRVTKWTSTIHLYCSCLFVLEYPKLGRSSIVWMLCSQKADLNHFEFPRVMWNVCTSLCFVFRRGRNIILWDWIQHWLQSTLLHICSFGCKVKRWTKKKTRRLIHCFFWMMTYCELTRTYFICVLVLSVVRNDLIIRKKVSSPHRTINASVGTILGLNVLWLFLWERTRLMGGVIKCTQLSRGLVECKLFPSWW